MSWINGTVFCLCITGASGSVLIALWSLLVALAGKRGNARYIYTLLRGTAVAYLFPAVFVAGFVYRRILNKPEGILTFSNRSTDTLLFLLFIVWLAGMSVVVLSQIYSLFYFQKVKKSMMAVPKIYQEKLGMLCKELRIRKRIRLRCGYGVQSPFIAGIFRTYIYLPVLKLEERDLEKILYHELIHFRQRDVLWKPLFGLIHLIYWFNPLAKYQWSQMKLWAEAGCDACCCNERFRAGEYFSLLLEMSGEIPDRNTMEFAPMWCEGSSEIEWRIERMKKYKSRSKNMTVALLLMAASVVAGGASTKAAMTGTEEVYDAIYGATVEEVEVKEQGNTLTEYAGTFEEVFVDTEVIEMPSSDKNTRTKVVNIDWTVKSGESFSTVKFKMSKGSEIALSLAISPDNKSVRAGIIESDGTVRYVTGSGIIQHTFSVKETGNYKVFVKNLSGSKVEVSGIYIK